MFTDYDSQARQNHWYPEALFGLCYEYLHPGERLLDIGAGTGLAAEPFARAGLQVYGFDISAEMLALFQAKGIAVELKQHDITVTPWPYETGAFEHIIAGGVLHFLAELEPVFGEIRRLLRAGGIFAFTTKIPPVEGLSQYQVETIQDTSLYLHQNAYLEALIQSSGFASRKELHLLIRTGRGTDDVFRAVVAQKV